MTLRRVLLVGTAATSLYAQDIQQTVQIALQNLNADLRMQLPAFAWQASERAWGNQQPLTQEEEMKILAIESVMRSDPERAVPLVEKVLRNPQASSRVRMRALQALASSGSEKAQQIVVQMAKDNASPELQARAVHLLGSKAGTANEQTLAEVYAGTKNIETKRQVIRSWAGSSSKDRLLQVAKTEPEQEIREYAIRRLGGMRASAELTTLYSPEASVAVREQVLRALAGANAWQQLLEIAKAEKNEDLRARAIQYAGNTRSAEATDALLQLYDSSSEPATRTAILRALSHQGSAKPLIALARKENNPELKRTALQHLTRMKGDDVTTFFTELLEK